MLERARRVGVQPRVSGIGAFCRLAQARSGAGQECEMRDHLARVIRGRVGGDRPEALGSTARTTKKRMTT